MSVYKGFVFALVVLAPLLLFRCSGDRIDNGGIASCNKTCTVYTDGSNSGCPTGCSCISDNYSATVGGGQNPPGKGSCWATSG
uniref:Short evasin n=1 Tax=Rhipicephalus sanguineus TaxID=34632 RepID=C9W1I5_RHISA